MFIEGQENLIFDTGGATRFGISEFGHPELSSAIRNGVLEEKHAKVLMFKKYWIESGAPEIEDENLAFMNADAAGNQGLKRANYFLEESKKYSTNVKERYERYRELRLLSYQADESIKEEFRSPEDLWEINGIGWLNRIDKLDEFVGYTNENNRFKIYHRTVTLDEDKDINKIAELYNIEPEVIRIFNGINDDSTILKKGSRLKIPRCVYKIKVGDNISNLAEKYGMSAEDLANINNIEDINSIKADYPLYFPISLHIVQKGETWSNISNKTAFSSEELMHLNNENIPESLQINQKIIIPGVFDVGYTEEEVEAATNKTNSPSNSFKEYKFSKTPTGTLAETILKRKQNIKTPAVLVVNGETNEILLQKGSGVEFIPASLTKLATCLWAIKTLEEYTKANNLDLRDFLKKEIIVTAKDTYGGRECEKSPFQKDQVKNGPKSKTEFELNFETLFIWTLVASDNYAATALVRKIVELCKIKNGYSGAISQINNFIDNEIGCQNTDLLDATGLPCWTDEKNLPKWVEYDKKKRPLSLFRYS